MNKKKMAMFKSKHRSFLFKNISKEVVLTTQSAAFFLNNPVHFSGTGSSPPGWKG